MQIKGTIRFFLIVFVLVSVYSLSFTLCTRQVEKKAKEYAYSEETRLAAKKLANGDALREQVIFDSISKAKEVQYLDSMKSEKIFNLLVKNYTYSECKERELNLGLDLKGGMYVTLEISEEDIIRALAANKTDVTLNKAIDAALKEKANSQENFLNLFVKNIKVIDANRPLSTYFLTRSSNEKLTTSSTDDEVKKYLAAEISSAMDRTFMVLRKRIDKFGVTQPNIQKLSTQGRILIELPGVKDPNRVRKVLQGTAKLEFWETWKLPEIYSKLEAANVKLRNILSKGLLSDSTKTAATDSTTTKKDSLANTKNDAKAKKDTNDLLSQLDNKSPKDTAKAKTQEEFAKQNPLFAFLQLNASNNGGQARLGEDAMVGYSASKDTAMVNKYFHLVADMFPNTKFLWSAKPVNQNEGRNVFQLIAIKVTSTDGTAPLEGDKIEDAAQDYDQNGNVEVTMQMNSDGARIWKKLTADNVGRQIAIVLDNYVYSFPVVNGEIPNGRSSITGSTDVAEAQDLANVLKSGKLPAPARIVEEAVVGPSLGREAINSGLISFLVAFALVLIYMIFFYNQAGVGANIALLCNVFFIFGVMASMGAVLTLSGIAGIVLTLGMAVDANVIIYERVKEEIRAGKGLRMAIDDGFKNAYSAIIDGNVTTLLAGIILYIFGSGPIQGFATTLIIGLITSMFTSIFVSRLYFIYLLDRNKKVTFSFKFSENFLANTKIDFVKYRWLIIAMSALYISIGIGFLMTKGLNLGVDFSGGRTYVVRFDQDVTTDKVRESLTVAFDQTPEVKTFGSNNQIKITTKYMIEDNSVKSDSIVETKLYNGLKSFYKSPLSYKEFTSDDDNKVLGRLSSQKVGPTIADDIRTAAVWAIIFALIVIFIYVALRFKNWQFGFGGVIALFHDSLIVLSSFSILYGVMPFNLEVDQAFIAAILTIIGYSINDTVVIFDRIREYRALYPKREFRNVLNDAINSTLARTINTSGTVLVVLLAIFFFGGDSIRGFIFALIIGVIAGCYSTVFIASPIAYDLMKLKKKK